MRFIAIALVIGYHYAVRWTLPESEVNLFEIPASAVANLDRPRRPNGEAVRVVT